MCDRVLVMYGGKVAAKGTVDEIFYETAHPYTAGLIKSIALIISNRSWCRSMELRRICLHRRKDARLQRAVSLR